MSVSKKMAAAPGGATRGTRTTTNSRASDPPEGVPAWAWAALGAEPDGRGGWLIPERSADGSICGTATRGPDGSKGFRPGGRRGLIVAWPLSDYAGSGPSDPVLICEGATDTAALLGLGFDALGVPMAGHCGDLLAELLKGRHAAIVADADDAGRRGADKLARHLLGATASVRIVAPPLGAKDARAAVIAGATRADFEESIRKAEPFANDDGPEPRAPRVPEYRPFPVDVLPEPVQSFVTEGAAAIGCDPCFVALPLLSGLASAIGNTHRIVLKRGWVEASAVWTLIVGESGTMKTPAFKLALRAIRKAQADAFKEHETARAAWELEQLAYEARLTAWKRDAAKAKPGDGYAAAPPEKPAPPIARRYIVSDTTIEAMAPILLGNPRGVLLARDELAGWLGSFDRYAKAGKAGADSAHWLSMHNGEAMTIDRKTGIPPTIHVPSASVSITGGIQPGILSRAMGQEHHESGLLARLLFAMPPRKPKRWTEADVSPETEASLSAVFDRLFSLTMEPDPESPPLANGYGPDMRPRLLRLSDGGKLEWVRLYNEHAAEQAELSGDLAAAWSKLEGYAARLALVLHLAEWAAGDDASPGPVDELSIARGVELSRWFGHEARRVYAILSESDDDRETRRLVEWIERKGGTVTVRDVTRGPREYRGDPERAAKALGELVAAGVGRWEVDDHAGGRGRPADRFRLLSRGGDTGDGDVNSGNAGDRGISVAVATVATPPDTGEPCETP